MDSTNQPAGSDTPVRDALAHQRTVLACERNLLAAERTFSAWIRTGLAGVGGGLALIRLFSFVSPEHAFIAHAAGYCLFLWGMLLFGFALAGYHRSVQRLNLLSSHHFSSRGMTLIAVSVSMLSLLLLILLALQ